MYLNVRLPSPFNPQQIIIAYIGKEESIKLRLDSLDSFVLYSVHAFIYVNITFLEYPRITTVKTNPAMEHC